MGSCCGPGLDLRTRDPGGCGGRDGDGGGSRWYLLPTLTTFLAFVMLLYDDPGSGSNRLWERVLETGLGVAAAAVFGLLLPAFLDRPRDTSVPGHGGP